MTEDELLQAIIEAEDRYKRARDDVMRHPGHPDRWTALHDTSDELTSLRRQLNDMRRKATEAVYGN